MALCHVLPGRVCDENELSRHTLTLSPSTSPTVTAACPGRWTRHFKLSRERLSNSSFPSTTLVASAHGHKPPFSHMPTSTLAMPATTGTMASPSCRHSKAPATQQIGNPSNRRQVASSCPTIRLWAPRTHCKLVVAASLMVSSRGPHGRGETEIWTLMCKAARPGEPILNLRLIRRSETPHTTSLWARTCPSQALGRAYHI